MADEPMMALTVRPPWSVAIARGWKLAENRSWRTSHRGLLAIHSGTTADRDALAFPPLAAAWEPGTPLHCRMVVAVATLEDCHPAGPCKDEHGPGMCDPWAMRGYDFHWVLSGVRALPEPVPCTGSRRLWPLPADVEKAVREQLEEAADVSR